MVAYFLALDGPTRSSKLLMAKFSIAGVGLLQQTAFGGSATATKLVNGIDV